MHRRPSLCLHVSAEPRGTEISAGVFEASQKRAEAAEIIAKHPTAMHLRFLQSLVEISAEKNNTVVLPVPVNWLTALLK